MMRRTRHDLGAFEVSTGKLVVSDPCYERGTWCAGVLENVKKGTWKADVLYSDEGKFGTRVKRLRARHDDVRKIRWLRKRHAPFDVGIDSGQAGFFDDDHFFPESDEWYGKACHATDWPALASVIDGGAVSQSGHGDGCYDCYYYTDDNDEVVAAELWFI